MKHLFILFSLLTLTSCAVKYGINLEAQKSTTNPKTKFYSAFGSSETNHGELSGMSFGIGITEETKYLITRINYISGTLSGEYNGTQTEVQEKGYLASIGFKIFGLQPRLVFGSLNYTNSDNLDFDHDAIGFGLAYEFDLGKSEDHHIYVAYDQLSDSGLDGDSGTRISLGYRYDFAKFNGAKD